MIQLLIVFGGAAATILVLGAVVLNAIGRERRRKERIERIGMRARAVDAEARRQYQLKRRTEAASPFLDGLAKAFLPRPAEVRARLHRTGRNISLGRYFLCCLMMAAAAALTVTVFTNLPWFAAVATGIVVGIGVPHMAIGYLVARRRTHFNNLFPDAIDLMVRGLRSGLPVTETIAACGREMIDPVGPEFRHIADRVRLGHTLEDALWEAARRLDTAEFKFFVISLSVQKETGGNLAETLANLADILRSRKQMRLKIKAMSSEARASALILGSLPFVMFGIIYFLSPEYQSMLFTDPRGRLMLMAGLGLMGSGIFVMSKMIRFDI